MQSSKIKQIYSLAKQIVDSYEDVDEKSRSYSYENMKESFHQGINRGCFIASSIMGHPIEGQFNTWEEFIKEFNEK